RGTVYFKMVFGKDMDKVNLSVYDIAGAKVAELYNGMVIRNTEYLVELDGDRLANGPYLYTLTTMQQTRSGKISIIK
ncbi:MAG: hypothetical protein V4615_17940, partial [Bacteroidota bacterium]